MKTNLRKIYTHNIKLLKREENQKHIKIHTKQNTNRW